MLETNQRSLLLIAFQLLQYLLEFEDFCEICFISRLRQIEYDRFVSKQQRVHYYERKKLILLLFMDLKNVDKMKYHFFRSIHDSPTFVLTQSQYSNQTQFKCSKMGHPLPLFLLFLVF